MPLLESVCSHVHVLVIVMRKRFVRPFHRNLTNCSTHNSIIISVIPYVAAWLQRTVTKWLLLDHILLRSRYFTMTTWITDSILHHRWYSVPDLKSYLMPVTWSWLKHLMRSTACFSTSCLRIQPCTPRVTSLSPQFPYRMRADLSAVCL